MKSISFWAKNHKTASRVLIIVIYVLLNVIGIFLGDILFSMGIVLSPLFYAVAIVISILGLLIYPSRKSRVSRKNFYFQQKSADIILLIATFIFIIYTGNSFYNSDFKGSPIASASNSIYVSINHSSTTIMKRKVVVSKKHGDKKLKNVIREFRKKYKSSTKGQKTLYIIISAIVAAGLIMGVSALACNIACSGSEALAYIVLFLGLGGIIFGLVKIIQRINRGGPKKKTINPTL